MENNMPNFEYPVLPLLPLRGVVLLPGTLLHFDVARKKSVMALQIALKNNQQIFLLTQRDARVNDPTTEDLYSIGTVAEIKQILKLPGDTIRVLVQGLTRGRMELLLPYRKCLKAQVMLIPEGPAENQLESVALMRRMKKLFEEYAANYAKISPDVMTTVDSLEEAGELADFLAGNIALDTEDRQFILEILDPVDRLASLISLVDKELEILAIEQEIDHKTHEQMDKNQRDYFLREQIKVIQSELDDGEDVRQEADDFSAKIRGLHLDEQQQKHLLKEASRLSKMPFGTAEATVTRNYLDICLDLPWNKKTKTNLDLEKAERILDHDHYGLEKVKERVLEYLAVSKLTEGEHGQVLCLVGPPGVGKTSIASSIAHAMGRKFVRVSLGGVRDEADIRGHRKTYVGSMPGRIIAALKTAGVKNPVMLLDEVDKMGSDHRGDPAAALLEVFDREQNHAFRDHFIELPFDLSDVVFIATANTADTISRPLLDRMERIELVSYTNNEKLEIAKRHLLPKQLKKHGLKKSDFKITDKEIAIVIEEYTRESGVRNLERELANLCRKAAVHKANGEKGSLKVTVQNLADLLGPKRYKPDDQKKESEIGVANGLAWTSVGGESLKIEVAVLEGTGKIELTGSLGDVMKESAKAALTYIRSRAELFNIDADFYKNTDIHIHIPEGAVPKDGPSAGITMATAILSALTKIPADPFVAMTGEITLRGRVLPIGGLREKTMAALKNGFTKVLIPADNEGDLSEIDPTVRTQLEFYPVANYDEVYPLIFEKEKILRHTKSEKRKEELHVLPANNSKTISIQQ